MQAADLHPPSRVWSALSQHAVEVLGAWLQRAWLQGWIRFDALDGQHTWPEELQRLFARQSLAMVDAHSVQPAPDAPTLDPEEAGVRLLARLENAIDLEGDEDADRWLDLARRLELGRAEVQLLALLVALQLDQALLRAFRYAAAHRERSQLTWGFAVKLLSARQDAHDIARLLDPRASRLFTSGLVAHLPPSAAAPLADHLLHVELDAARLLVGWPLADDALLTWEALPEPPRRVQLLLRKRLRRAAALPTPLRIAVSGPEGAGRLAAVAAVAQAAGTRAGLWRVELEQALRRGTLQGELRRAAALAALLDAGLVLIDAGSLETPARLRLHEETLDALQHTPQPVAWILHAPPPLHLLIPPETTFALGYPSRAERLQTWAQALPEDTPPAVHEQLAGHFLLAEGQIRAVAQRVVAAYPDDTPDARLEHLLNHAREAAQVGLGQLATPEPGRVRMEQLVVSPETDLALHEMISYVRNRHRLAQEWGFARTLPYGLGVTALFAGPPGTGKTFGAQAIATALNLELYRVDLSQIVSKYIGETEKHLGALFNAAEQGEIMLLFDEADSLFGKRTEVKTSVDRYANLEVNFLLQRIERFTGVIILTTNFEAGIDDAFARRIRFRVAFDEPNAEARLKLWRKLLPPEVPLEPRIDFQDIAQTYELSGGHIKEVILRAAALAMDSGTSARSCVTEDLIRRSADLEYKKLGRLPVGS